MTKRMGSASNPKRDLAKPLPGAFRRITAQALFVFGIVVFISGLVAFRYFLLTSYTGIEFNGRTIGAVDSGSPAAVAGAQVGDLIESVNRIPMPEGKPYLHSGDQVVLLTVLRTGQSISLEIQPTPPPLKTIINRVGVYFIAFAFWLIAMVVLAAKPQGSTSRVFVLLCLLSTLGIAILPLADLGMSGTDLVVNLILLAIGPLFVYYHTTFPEHIDFKGRKFFLALLWLVGIGLALISVIVLIPLPYPWLEPLHQSAWYTLVFSGTKLFFVICLASSLALLLRALRAAELESSKRQVAIVLIGTALAVGPLIVLILLPQLLHLRYLTPSWLVFLVIVFIPASYYYVTFRHNLMKLDRAINRTIAFFLLSLTFAALYLGLRWVLPDVFSGPITLADIALVAILVFLFAPLRKGVERLIDSAFYGGWYDCDELVHRMSGALNDALDTQTIVDLLVDDLAPTMRFKEVAVLLPGEKGSFDLRENRGFRTPMPISCPSPLSTVLLEIGEPVRHEVLCGRVRRDSFSWQEIACWTENGAQVWIPLVQQRQMEGILVLGTKIADEFLAKQDYHALGSLAHQAAVAIARTKLVDELRGQVQKIQALARQVLALEEENQQQMALELHDMLLQDLFAVRNILEPAETTFLPDNVRRVHEKLGKMALYLRSVLFELHPPAGANAGLCTLLENYIFTFQEDRDLPVVFKGNGNGNGIHVPNSVQAAMLRVVREALNNTWKHAEAQMAWVVCDLQSDRIHLEIRDNGVGFEVPTQYGSDVGQNHFGLFSMRERVKNVGGEFDLQSRCGKGTRIVVKVPLSTSPEDSDT